ncbi:MAG: ABC transporter substrate-binding protein [Propionibacteriaceae bacterium]|jgi:raffinose/stachyose/melibiose transport system substrate-binding protein|nr:ABC transporter substrate-binding protein [Propionibacteriaceae bacterium]
MNKKIVALTAATAIALAGLAACSGGSGSGSDTGQVYFLNFKPEVADVWEAIAKDYTAETGVSVKVVTAASGTYEQTLTSEIAKSDAPTVFQINGPVGYANWKDYTADLTDSDLYKHLSDQTLAITGADGGVYGIPYVVEGYGIIYNDAIMKKYFALADQKSGLTDATEIQSFDQLKTVVEDMTAHKADLGIQGVFSNTSLKPGDDWRWQTHLMNVPLYYEFKDSNVDLSAGTPATIKFSYADGFKKLFDLYLDNSTVEKTQLGSKTVDEAMAEFALGQSAMVQNGNWGWSQVAGVAGNTVLAEDVHFLPLYIGVSGEKSQGLCIGTENYFSINKDASAADQQASLDFLYWVFSSDKGKDYVANQLGFIAPFDTFATGEGPSDPLATEVSSWMAKDGVTSVPWVFSVMPSQDWKNNFGGELLTYAQGSTDWATVVSDTVADWATQAKAAAEAAG